MTVLQVQLVDNELKTERKKKDEHFSVRTFKHEQSTEYV